MKEFNPKKEILYLQYSDFNSMYATEMCGKFSIGNFKWMTSKELKNLRKIFLCFNV